MLRPPRLSHCTVFQFCCLFALVNAHPTQGRNSRQQPATASRQQPVDNSREQPEAAHNNFSTFRTTEEVVQWGQLATIAISPC